MEKCATLRLPQTLARARNGDIPGIAPSRVKRFATGILLCLPQHGDALEPQLVENDLGASLVRLVSRGRRCGLGLSGSARLGRSPCARVEEKRKLGGASVGTCEYSAIHSALGIRADSRIPRARRGARSDPFSPHNAIRAETTM